MPSSFGTPQLNGHHNSKRELQESMKNDIEMWALYLSLFRPSLSQLCPLQESYTQLAANCGVTALYGSVELVLADDTIANSALYLSLFRPSLSQLCPLQESYTQLAANCGVTALYGSVELVLADDTVANSEEFHATAKIILQDSLTSTRWIPKIWTLFNIPTLFCEVQAPAGAPALMHEPHWQAVPVNEDLMKDAEEVIVE
ncbi:hypothetical protein B0H10DRAFT_1942260 [Mycena sp. CBHHK59/15]|nr:hypothetical protein B0H10DRAFT_1942260 [Mycena sp. CBHHK59/15]